MTDHLRRSFHSKWLDCHWASGLKCLFPLGSLRYNRKLVGREDVQISSKEGHDLPMSLQRRSSWVDHILFFRSEVVIYCLLEVQLTPIGVWLQRHYYFYSGMKAGVGLRCFLSRIASKCYVEEFINLVSLFMRTIVIVLSVTKANVLGQSSLLLPTKRDLYCTWFQGRIKASELIKSMNSSLKPQMVCDVSEIFGFCSSGQVNQKPPTCLGRTIRKVVYSFVLPLSPPIKAEYLSNPQWCR